MLRFLLFILALGQGVIVVYGFCLFALIFADKLHYKLVNIIGAPEYLIAFIEYAFGLRQLCKLIFIFSRSVVNVFLIFRHTFNILFKGSELALFGGIEHHKVKKLFLVHAVICRRAVLNLAAEGIPELFVFFRFFCLHFDKSCFNLLFNICGNGFKLTVVLQHFAAYVKRNIRSIHNAADKAEVFRQQVGTFIHNQHAGGIKLQAFFKIAGIVVIRSLCRNEQQRFIAYHALRGNAYAAKRVFKVTEFLFIKIVVFLLGDFVFVLLPNRNHGVYGFPLFIFFPLRLIIFGSVRRFFFLTAFCNFHADRITDIVGIFLYKMLQTVFLKIFTVVLFLGIGLYVHNNVRTDGIFFTFGDGIAVRAFRFPFICLIRTVCFRNNGNLVTDHKRGIETHAELTDNIGVALGFVLIGKVFFELERAALCYGAEVVLKLFFRHADTVIRNGKCAVFLIRNDHNFEVGTVHAHLVIRQCDISELVYCVACVGDYFSEENLFVRIDGVYHKLQKPF